MRRRSWPDRVFLREILWSELHIRPDPIVLDVTASGKPRLSDGKHGIWFSQSATNGRDVAVISRTGEAGVDVESLDGPLDRSHR